MSMSGAVCQRCSPDRTGREADNGGNNHRVDGYREAQVATGESEGGETPDATDATGERREEEKKLWQVTDANTTHEDQQQSAESRGQPNNDTGGGGRVVGGQSRVHPDPGGTLSLGGIQRLGSHQLWHQPRRRHRRRCGVEGVVA